MASCENPGLLEKAGVDGRSVDRLWLRSVSRRAKTMRDPRHWFPSLAGERQVIAVDHGGAAGEAEQRQHVRGRAALDAFGVVGVISDQAAADLGAVRSAYDDGVAAAERA